jgi:fatty-acyl-CoA synthase
MALVVRDSESTKEVTDLDIKAYLKTFAEKGMISKYGIPEKVLFVDQLARTSVGKINKKELREKYGDT